MKFFYLVIIILMLLFSVNAEADIAFYVSEGGSGDGSACNNARTLDWANRNLVAGETAILCDDGGDFTTYVIDPINSGSAESGYITYQSENANVVIDANNPDAAVSHGSPIDLRDGQDYIKVIGPMTIRRPDDTNDGLIFIKNGTNIVIDNITGKLNNAPGKYALIEFIDSQYIEILNSDFTGDQTTNIQHDLIRPDNVQHLLVYNTKLHEVTHDDFGPGRNASTAYVVVKNCTFDNKWRSGMTEHNTGGQYMVEGSTFANIGNDADNNPFLASTGDPGSTLRGGGDVGRPTIWRRNLLYNLPEGMRVYGSAGGPSAPDRFFYIYHNTTYNTWYDSNAWYSGQSILFIPDDSDTHVTDNRVINNIFSTVEPHVDRDYMAVGSSREMSNNRIENNIFYDVETPKIRWDRSDIETVAWQDANSADGWANNLSEDPLMTDPANADFTLQLVSPAINTGTYLTRVNDSDGGSGTSLVVDDAGFFFSEETWDIPDTTGVVESDTIYVNNPSSADFSIRITAVDYSSNTLTLANPQTWDDNAEVHICPGGICFSGSAPDMGAFEYNGIDTTPPAQPVGLEIIE